MSTTNSKQKIQSALQSFSKGNLTENALNLFQTLGYNTERQSPLDKPTFAAFKASFIDTQSTFSEEKAKVEDWKYVDLLFQLSKEEILKQMSRFDTKQVDRTIIETYLFFTIELVMEHYSRTALSHITRLGDPFIRYSLPPYYVSRSPIRKGHKRKMETSQIKYDAPRISS